MHNETPADLGRVLSFAATYLEERGRARFKFGAPGQPMCPVAAIAVALGFSPRRIGWASFFFLRTRAQHAVGVVVLRSGLLNRLPVAARSGGRRRVRPAVMSPYRAVRELAKWSDDKALDDMVIGALRARAAELSQKASRPRPVPASS